MTERLTLEVLIVAVAQMRAHQRAFFESAQGSPERRAAYVASKTAEKRVDALLEAAKAPPPQGSLFGGQR